MEYNWELKTYNIEDRAYNLGSAHHTIEADLEFVLDQQKTKFLEKFWPCLEERQGFKQNREDSDDKKDEQSEHKPLAKRQRICIVCLPVHIS
jgi:hypothetical protein